MYKKLAKIFCLFICMGIIIFMLTSCTDPFTSYFADDNNYVQFTGKIIEVGYQEDDNYIWVKLNSQFGGLNFELEFWITESNYKELQHNNFSLSICDNEYVFLSTKDPYILPHYDIISICDLEGNVYLDREVGKENLILFAKRGY